MNMFVHEMDGARIEWCNTITSPKLVEDDRLMKFDIVVANRPSRWTSGALRWPSTTSTTASHRGLPPKSRGDYAFISHMVEAAVEGEGRVGVIVPHGVLFRAGSEGKIRQKLIEEKPARRRRRPAGQPLLRHRHPGRDPDLRQGQAGRRHPVHRRQRGVRGRQEPEPAPHPGHRPRRGGVPGAEGGAGLRPRRDAWRRSAATTST